MNMDELMSQAKELQSKVSAAQDKLATIKVKGIAGAGKCIVEMTGKYDLLNLTISDSAMSYSASELSKIVMSALQDAKSKADAVIDKTMAEATDGVEMPEF